jgi:hypothetical protein
MMRLPHFTPSAAAEDVVAAVVLPVTAATMALLHGDLTADSQTLDVS